MVGKVISVVVVGEVISVVVVCSVLVGDGDGTGVGTVGIAGFKLKFPYKMLKRNWRAVIDHEIII